MTFVNTRLFLGLTACLSDFAHPNPHSNYHELASM